MGNDNFKKGKRIRALIPFFNTTYFLWEGLISEEEDASRSQEEENNVD